jgi:hypothetical protein
MGFIMCMGSYSGVRRSLVYFLIVNIILSQFCFIRSAFAHPAAVAIAEVFAGVMARRAVVTTGMNLARVSATRFAVRAAANDALFSIPATSSLRIGGYMTWGAAASAIGGYSVSQLLSSNDSLELATNATLNSDGSYTVTINKDGVTKDIRVNFKPDVLSPVFIYVKSVTKGEPDKISGVFEGYSYPDNAIYYVSKESGTFAPYYYGDNYQDLAIQAQQFRTYALYSPSYEDFSKTVTNKHVDADGNISFTEQLYQFRYIESESTFDFDVVGVDADKSLIRNPNSIEIYHPDIVGLPYYYDVYIKVLEHEKRINYDFEPCKTTTDKNGSTTTICIPPGDSDYINTDNDFTYRMHVITNTGFKLSNVDAVVGNLSDVQEVAKSSLKRQAIDYDVLAKIFNELMNRTASNSDYDGVPFSPSKPITANEIKAVAQQMGLNLTQYDLMYSTIPDNDFLPNVEKHYNTLINNNVNNGNSNNNNKSEDEDEDDFDAEFIPPELEEIPTGVQVLSYLDELFPFLRDFELQEKLADCPTAEITAFNKKYLIDTHCPLLQQNKSLFQTIMLIVWAFVSLRIILKA